MFGAIFRGTSIAPSAATSPFSKLRWLLFLEPRQLQSLGKMEILSLFRAKIRFLAVFVG